MWWNEKWALLNVPSTPFRGQLSEQLGSWGVRKGTIVRFDFCPVYKKPFLSVSIAFHSAFRVPNYSLAPFNPSHHSCVVNTKLLIRKCIVWVRQSYFFRFIFSNLTNDMLRSDFWRFQAYKTTLICRNLCRVVLKGWNRPF